MVTVSRSRHPYGPYEPCLHNPILSHRSRRSPIHATGHADLVQAQDGTWWAVFLGIRPVSYPMRHHLGRETYLAPVTWTADGWPSIGFEGRVEQVMDSPQRRNADGLQSRPETISIMPPSVWTGSFAQPITRELVAGTSGSRGNPSSLNDAASPAFVGRRLSHFSCNISALDFEPANEGRSGINRFMNERYHYDLAVKLINGKNDHIQTYRGVAKRRTNQPMSGGACRVTNRSNAEHFRFSMGQSSSEFLNMGSGETHLLATEVAGGFTGLMIAIYAFGDNGTTLRCSTGLIMRSSIPGPNSRNR